MILTCQGSLFCDCSCGIGRKLYCTGYLCQCRVMCNVIQNRLNQSFGRYLAWFFESRLYLTIHDLYTWINLDIYIDHMQAI